MYTLIPAGEMIGHLYCNTNNKMKKYTMKLLKELICKLHKECQANRFR